MVALKVSSRIQALGAGLAMVVGFGANPALASSSAAVDISAPVRAAQSARTTGGDEEFRRLFSSWKSLDNGNARVALPTASSVGAPGLVGTGGITSSQRVSIPSRMPLDGARLTSSYGMRYHPVLGGYRAHTGIDLAQPVGTPVYATADGVVSRADWFGGYGLYISLEHGGSIQTRYGHLSRLNVASGQMVRKGELIGFVGSTGRSTGPHLHYEVRIAGAAVNPIPYMTGAATIAD